MPLVPSDFVGLGWTSNGHVETMLPALVPRRSIRWSERERLELDDGDFLDLRWMRNGRRRLVIVCHGLEGSAEASYVRGLAAAVHAAGWDALAWNFRGCGAEQNRLMRSYHSGESGDLRAVVQHARTRYDRVAVVGFSLGGNIVLKFAAETEVPSSLVAVVAVSAPVDLASSARRMDEVPSNIVYRRRFLRSLVAKTLVKARKFPELRQRLAGQDGVAAVRTIREFDQRITAPVHGFDDADDYWARCSAAPLLPRLALPALMLNARNDPLLDDPSFPEQTAHASPWLHLECPDRGGHVGFLDRRHGLHPWHEQRICQFLESFTGR
jgi:predicted alpha/beta-fold hydrolase